MESQIERISPVECRVRVEIPWDKVSPRLSEKMRNVQKKARIRGFRPGKVPPQMIEQMFGKSVRDELARELAEETFYDAVKEHQQNPLTAPAYESHTLNKNEPFKYVARFEVLPEIDPKDYVGVAVQRQKPQVDETKVDELIKAKQTELTELRPIEDAERQVTQAGDIWTIDVEGTLGSAKLSKKDLRVEIGSDRNDFLPGLNEVLRETPLDAVGTTKTLQFLPPQDRIRPEYQGVEAHLTIGFRDVREQVVPELDDEFACDTGDAETLAELKEKYAEQVREESRMEVEREARMQLVGKLLETNSFEVAPSMIAQEVKAQVDAFKQRLRQQGVTAAQMGMSDGQIASQMRPQAAFHVKAFLLLDAIGKKENITVSDEELNEELQKMATESNQNLDRMRAKMEKDHQLLLLRMQMREEKILDFLMSKANVEEIDKPATAEATEAETSTETANTSE